MYYTYILYSESIDRYYIGYSADPEKRLEERHNNGLVRSTKRGRPCKLIAKKAFETRKDAMDEELRLKRAKNRKYINWLEEGGW